MCQDRTSTKGTFKLPIPQSHFEPTQSPGSGNRRSNRLYGPSGKPRDERYPNQSISQLPLRRQIPPSILLTIYIYGYRNRIKAGAANFAYGASKDSIYLRNHLHRSVFDCSLITAQNPTVLLDCLLEHLRTRHMLCVLLDHSAAQSSRSCRSSCP